MVEYLQHIFSTLLSHGRLVAPQLVQKCRLPLRQIQHGLTVMLQAGLVCHHTTSEGRTSYEANPRNAYYLVRSGRVLECARKRYGNAAAGIVTQLLILGHASVGQLKKSSQAYEGSHDKDNENDGADSSSCLERSAKLRPDAELDSALRTLCQHGLVCRLRGAHLRTEADNRQTAEENVYSHPNISIAKGTKLKEEFATKIEEAMAKQSDSWINLLSSSSNSIISHKRKMGDLNEDTPNPKRLKMTNGVAMHEANLDPNLSIDIESNSFNESLVVRLNYARIAILFRNSQLLSLVSNNYGRNVSRTYEAVLNQLEPGLPDPTEDTSLGPENERSMQSSHEVDENRLAQDIACHERHKEHSGPQWTSINGLVNGVSHRLTPEARSHLQILCEQPCRFLSHSLEHPEKYVVEYSDLSVHLRNAEIFRLVSSRFDKYALRVIRVLLDKGKMDEKYLQEIVLMSAKELRQTLATLKQAGFLELQEVPREAQRQPSRTMYLWFYDPDRVRKMLIEETHKSMARCFQRMKVEGDKVKPTIEKSERSDVRGKEAKLLAKAELEVLKEWRRKEEWLLGEVGRLDELVFVLRDF